MKTHVADARLRVMCLRIVPKTGSPIYLTHHIKDLTMGGHTYLSSSGYDFTGYSSTTSMSPGVVDLDGISGMAGISYDTISSGVFDNARAYLFATTWNAPIEDEEPIVASTLGKATMMDKKYTIEEMSLIDALNQSVGKTYTVACSRTFGDSGCQVALAPITVTGTLTSATSQSVFSDSARGEADDYFAAGTIKFTSGLNANLKPLEIKSYGTGGAIEVFEAFHYPPAVGDAYTMIPGCRKRQADCRDKWSNIINFFGFSYIPTGSTYAQIGDS